MKVWTFSLYLLARLEVSRALLGVKGVPAIRRLDRRKGMIEMDYIWGSDLRSIFAGNGSTVDYQKVSRMFDDAIADRDNRLSRELADLLGRVLCNGVIPRDIQAGNFVRARRSGALYIVDLNLTDLRPVPGWRAHARNIAPYLGFNLHSISKLLHSTQAD